MSNSAQAPVEHDSITLDAVDKTGISRKVNLRATIVTPGNKSVTPIHKNESVPDDAATSRKEDDDKYQRLLGNKIIRPPVNLDKMIATKDESTELDPAINAMTTNTVSFGWQLKERDLQDDFRTQNEKKIKEEKLKLKIKLETIHPVDSLVMLRERAQIDKHSCGNGYLERIESPKGELVGLDHVPGHTVRLTTKDCMPTKVRVPMVRPDTGYMLDEVVMWYRFRRFVQVREDESIVWFKEAGDPRQLNWKTGEYAQEGEVIPFQNRATSLIHFKIYHPTTPYGMPVWYGNSLSVRNSRTAEEINYNTLNSNNIPSMMVIVENGQLTQASIDRLKEWTEKHIAASQNYSSFIILEGEAAEEGTPNPANFRIRIERLKNEQQKDELFQELQEHNANRIRQAFRLPPIFVGRCHSADTEYLTEKGWKRYEDISDSEKVATLNPATGAIEYQQPTARHSYDYDGKLLHLKNRGVDALVTPNHRMWTRPTVQKSRSEKPWQFVNAEDLIHVKGGHGGGCLELKNAASWVGNPMETFLIPRNSQVNGWSPEKGTKNRSRDLERYAKPAPYEVPGDLFIQFLGYYISEGSITETPGPIVLSQNKGEVADRIITVVKGLGFDPTVTESREGQLNICFSHVGLWAWLGEHCGVDSSTKKIPKAILNVSQEQLEILLDALVEGDGSLPQLGSDGSFTYSTTSELLNDQLHEVCLKLGVALTSRCQDRSEEGWNPIYCSYGHYDTRHLIKPKDHISAISYKGSVSCFTVPNGLLVTRRGGRVLISGNSDDYTRATADTSRDIADEQVFSAERQRDDHLIQRFVLLPLGSRYHTFRSNHPNITDDIELIRLMAIAEKSGAMTPRRADRIIRDVFGDNIGPMPKGIDLDMPYGISFAHAQQGISGGSQPGVAQDEVSRLLDMRTKIEKELDRRYDLAVEDD